MGTPWAYPHRHHRGIISQHPSALLCALFKPTLPSSTVTLACLGLPPRCLVLACYGHALLCYACDLLACVLFTGCACFRYCLCLLAPSVAWLLPLLACAVATASPAVPSRALCSWFVQWAAPSFHRCSCSDKRKNRWAITPSSSPKFNFIFVQALFYDFCVSRIIWSVIFEITGVPVITDFESLG
jgi:hypothetical protein